MRLATLILALILILVIGLQSCAIAVGVSVAESLSTAAEDKQEAEDLAGAGALGLLATLLWLIGAALVIVNRKSRYGCSALPH